MATPQRERHNDMEQQEHDQHAKANLYLFLEEQVIRTLGRPGKLLRVQVRRLWEGRYRVNIFVGEDAATAKMAHSYFLKADANGRIAESIPKLTRQY